jgi:nicotinate phosphoribosyltransferase
MLDAAGLDYVGIVASNDLDETLIFNLKAQGAKIDSWGIGTQLITGGSEPALGGVYKLVAREHDGAYEPVIKISANPEKVTTPGLKNVYRIVNRQTGKAIADYITLFDEDDVRQGKRIKLFDPVHPYINQYVDDYSAVPLLRPVFAGGQLVEPLPSLADIREFHREQLQLFSAENLRKLNPETYPVSLSIAAWELKMSLLGGHGKK